MAKLGQASGQGAATATGATTTALVMRKWQRKRTNQEPLTYGHKPQEWVHKGREELEELEEFPPDPYAPFAICSVRKEG